MSNIFKTNNRFDFLCENKTHLEKNNKENKKKNNEIKENNFKNTNNTKKNNEFEVNNFKNINNTKNSKKYDLNNNVEFKNLKKNKFDNYDDIIEYPKLVNTTNKSLLGNEDKDKIIKNDKSLYKNLLIKKDIQNSDNENLIKKEVIPDGHLVLSYSDNKRNVAYNYGNVKKNNVLNTHNLILDKLADNFVFWKENYIETWGEDEYEKTFRFSNYDYNYFNKLDYEYEMLMDKLYEKQEHENDIISDDEYNNLEYKSF
jgi:hypothetical protein